MNFNNHSRLEGQHAFLSASKYHWINYDEDKLVNAFIKYQATQRGTELHALACQCIRLGVKLPKTRNTLNLYVNDAIGFKMQTEQPLYFSDNCFGTADTISFKKNVLRIHDLKTGETPASMKQLMIYNALFCLEYGFKPNEIEIELRLYQSDDVIMYTPEPYEIYDIMEKIIAFDKKIEQLKIGG
jgi:hypothetical protein